jgi:hypothetical protein
MARTQETNDSVMAKLTAASIAETMAAAVGQMPS